MSTTLTAEDFGAHFDAEHYFRFVESEDAVIMAWGHREPGEFLDEVFAYDTLCDPTYAERGNPGDIQHRWAVRIAGADDVDGGDGWWIKWSTPDGPVTESTPGAFAVTIWMR